MRIPAFARSADERVLAGVCAGIAEALAVDVTLVRLVFALLALAGGAGILLYFALWAYGSSQRPTLALLLVVAAGILLLGAVGMSSREVGGIALVAVGLAVVWRSPGRFRRDAPLSYGGLALPPLGVVLLLPGGGPAGGGLPPRARARAPLPVGGPRVCR